jgi:L-alanine-DL-glutamate epimerase-like enolase superfamily enzyme
MKITDVETIFVDRYLFVHVRTDAGITGLGESGAWGFLESSEQAVQEYPGDEASIEKSEIVDAVARREGDALVIPDRPGIGIALAPDAAERRPYRPRLVDTRLGTDGAVVDQ